MPDRVLLAGSVSAPCSPRPGKVGVQPFEGLAEDDALVFVKVAQRILGNTLGQR
jgi:hypothetical protein